MGGQAQPFPHIQTDSKKTRVLSGKKGMGYCLPYNPIPSVTPLHARPDQSSPVQSSPVKSSQLYAAASQTLSQSASPHTNSHERLQDADLNMVCPARVVGGEVAQHLCRLLRERDRCLTRNARERIRP